METHWFPHNALNQRLFLLVLCVFTMTWNVSAKENAPSIQLRGELGGNVSFTCPVNPKSYNFLYLQKVTGDKESFVNGYHASRPLTGAWENTWLDENRITVHMHSLNVSHEGDYTCHIDDGTYEDTKTDIHLSITANYSKPEIKVLHSDNSYWFVNCSSHGGYPRSEIIWNSDRSVMMKDVNKSEISDAVTMTFNSSSAAYFNCSMGEIWISCSVGAIDSQLFSVCKPKDLPTLPFDTSSIAIGAISLSILLLFVSIIVVLYLRKRCKRRPGVAAPAVVRLELVNGQEKLETPLTGVAVAY